MLKSKLSQGVKSEKKKVVKIVLPNANEIGHPHNSGKTFPLSLALDSVGLTLKKPHMSRENISKCVTHLINI